MATEEATIDSREGHPREKMSHSEDPLPVLADISTPLNFAQLTPSQFGISCQSFTPASSNHKDKSRLAQIKARRRSNIGVRGSPETNSLIRFMAQQRMKNSSHQQTPELVKSSPHFPRVPSTLRQKMASFQSLMDVEESEVRDPAPERDDDARGCIKTRDYLSDGGKENLLPTTAPTKRRRVGPLKGCEVEIREASTPSILHFTFKEQEEDKEPAAQTVTKGPLPSAETAEDAHAVLVSPPHRVDNVLAELPAFSPVSLQQDGDFELQTPSRVPSDDLAAVPPAEPSSPFHIPSLPSLLEMKPAGEDPSSAGKKTKNKKRVHFGGPLSPEFFDKNLPPSTPLQKGGTPARAPTPGGSLNPRSALKTPQRNEPYAPKAHPDLGSPRDFGASPTLTMPRHSRTKREEPDEEDGKMVFPSLEESAVTCQTELVWDPQLNLNAAFHEESFSENLTESSHPECKASPSGHLDIKDQPESLPEDQKQPEVDVEAPARPGSRKRKPEDCDSTPEAPSRSSSRKRKLPDESEPVKRSTRSAAKSASGKMKVTSAAGRQWNKEVNRSLYGSRAYASKNPTLSPITERLSFISPSPAAQQTSASNQKPDAPQEFGESVIRDPTSEAANDTQEISSNATKDNLQAPLEAPVVPHHSNGVTRKGRKSWGQRVAPRVINRRRVSIPDRNALDERPQTPPEDKTETTTCSQVSAETPPGDTAAQHEGFDMEERDAPTSADPTVVDSQGESERHACADASTPARPPLGDELNTLSVPAESAQRGAKQAGSRSGGQQMSCDEEEVEAEKEEGRGGGAASRQTNNHGSGSDGHNTEAASLDLAPWQAEFNFEDVFKPVATRGQRSVRRSLRNQSNAESSSNSAGLVWLPRSSPNTSKDARRRTRSRRFCAPLPVQHVDTDAAS